MKVAAMVLAAGYGTRMAPLSDWLPKPAIPLLNRPLLHYAFAVFRELVCDEIHINTHHLSTSLCDVAGQWSKNRIRIHHEATILGTAGGVSQAMDNIDADIFLVTNSDVVCLPNLNQAIAQHVADGAFATMVVTPHPDAVSYGGLYCERTRVASILTPTPGLAASLFTGTQILSRDALRSLPAEGCLVRDGYMKWLAEDRHIGAFHETSGWHDAGTLSKYAALNLAVARGDLMLDDISRSNAGVVAPDVSFEHGQVENSVVGANVRIEPGVLLRDVIVWPNTHIRESLSRVIATPFGVVPFE